MRRESRTEARVKERALEVRDMVGMVPQGLEGPQRPPTRLLLLGPLWNVARKDSSIVASGRVAFHESEGIGGFALQTGMQVKILCNRTWTPDSRQPKWYLNVEVPVDDRTGNGEPEQETVEEISGRIRGLEDELDALVEQGDWAEAARRADAMAGGYEALAARIRLEKGVE